MICWERVEKNDGWAIAQSPVGNFGVGALDVVRSYGCHPLEIRTRADREVLQRLKALLI